MTTFSGIKCIRISLIYSPFMFFTNTYFARDGTGGDDGVKEGLRVMYGGKECV